MEEANILKSQHDKRKKYFEQRMKKNNLDKVFSNFVNVKEMQDVQVQDLGPIDAYEMR